MRIPLQVHLVMGGDPGIGSTFPSCPAALPGFCPTYSHIPHPSLDGDILGLLQGVSTLGKRDFGRRVLLPMASVTPKAGKWVEVFPNHHFSPGKLL